MDQRIKLQAGEWTFDADKPLGPAGGFGEVFQGRSKYGSGVAVKRLHIEAAEAAHRELRIANLFSGRDLHHVIPILDSGRDAESDHYFVVMPRAEKSLQDVISKGADFSNEEVVKILLQVLEGLIEASDIVHRDLKPGNVLYHDSRWKVADFGIARFVEESTSLRTLKGCLTPQFAAPEQWSMERASSATDIYALGCIGYALMTGQPPFAGTLPEDLRRQHLHSEPPSLKNCSPRLASLLLMMLRKSPEARPSQQRVKDLLNSLATIEEADQERMAFSELARAGLEVASSEVQAESERQSENSKAAQRKRLADEAGRILDQVVDFLFEQILLAAPSANRDGESSLRLGGGQLVVSRPLQMLKEGLFGQSGWDVICGSRIEAIQVTESCTPYVWSSSLWYARLKEPGEYRWYEVSYFGGRHSQEPFALDPSEADVAAGPGLDTHRIAFGPVTIDDECIEEFSERWSLLLARAARGQLSHPRSLPLGENWWK